jgi:hypothetical protein
MIDVRYQVQKQFSEGSAHRNVTVSEALMLISKTKIGGIILCKLRKAYFSPLHHHQKETEDYR